MLDRSLAHLFATANKEQRHRVRKADRSRHPADADAAKRLLNLGGQVRSGAPVDLAALKARRRRRELPCGGCEFQRVRDLRKPLRAGHRSGLGFGVGRGQKDLAQEQAFAAARRDLRKGAVDLLLGDFGAGLEALRDRGAPDQPRDDEVAEGAELDALFAKGGDEGLAVELALRREGGLGVDDLLFGDLEFSRAAACCWSRSLTSCSRASCSGFGAFRSVRNSVRC